MPRPISESNKAVAGYLTAVSVNIDPPSLRRLSQILGAEGIDLFPAPDTAHLSETVTRHRANVIVMGAAGEASEDRETLKTLRAIPNLASVPVLLLTPESISSARLRDAIAAGADDYIDKQAPPEVVARRVAALASLNKQTSFWRLSEQGYLPLTETLPAVIYVRKAEHPYAHIYLSPNADSLGFSYSEWQRSNGTWEGQIHPDDRERVLASIAASLSSGGETELEYRLNGRDGQIHWVSDRGRAVRDADQRVMTLRGVMLDITEKKLAEEAFRQSQQRYRAVVDQSINGIYLADSSTARIIEANPAFRRLLGYDIDDLTELTLYDICNSSREDIDNLAAQVLKHLQCRVGERRYVRKDGSLVDVEVFASLVQYADRTAFCITCTDITERKIMERALRQSEEHFRSLMENALDLITIVDANGAIRYQSPSVERTLGYRAEDLIGKCVFDYIHPEDVPALSDALVGLMNSNNVAESSEIRVLHSDGSWRTVEAIGKSSPPETGIAGVVVNSRDVTERKQLQEQLIRSEKLAAMGQLVSGVAHELNNPLTSVIGFTQLLLASDALDERSRERLEIVGSQADRARRIVHNLLSFGRQHKPARAEIDLNHLLSKILELRAYHFQVNNIVILHEFGQVPPVQGDGSQLEQVFLNILINAEQAILSHRRAGAIAIKTELKTIRGIETVCTTITDDGPGMNQETIGRIFDPFFTTKEVGKGTGLGLSISYGIVKEHGGQVEVTSSPGAGASFVVEIPAYLRD